MSNVARSVAFIAICLVDIAAIGLGVTIYVTGG